MNKLLLVAAMVLAMSAAPQALMAQSPKSVSVLLETVVQDGTSPTITLRWPADSKAVEYVIGRKERTWSSFNPMTTLPGTATEWIDSEIEPGVSYEYAVEKTAIKDSIYAYGYASAGLRVPVAPVRGHCLILADSVMYTALSPEIARLQNAMTSEGWMVTVLSAARAPKFNPTAVKATKQIIRDWYETCQGEPGTVFIVGRVAVPYSGMVYQGRNQVGPDAHPEHSGAWAADSYYSCLADEVLWLDEATNTVGAYPDTKNLPGDGRYDNLFIPSTTDLRLGRVDLYNMGLFYKDSTLAGTVKKVDSLQSEISLLRKYINRNLQYRSGATKVVSRGLIDDNFGSYGEAFARSAWMNYAPLLGAANIKETDYLTTLDTASYLWSYGCGGGGSDFQSCGGVGNSAGFAKQKLQTIFTMLFGSYFGDWDKANNLLRAPLAVDPGALTNCWAGRPFWYFHTMGLGETVGDSYLNTINNTGTYIDGVYPHGVHIALMGDPTLRMNYGTVPPVTALQAEQVATPKKGVKLTWSAPSGGGIAGYYIYRQEGTGAWQVLNGDAVWPETSYTDERLVDATVRYAVRTVGLVSSASGTFYDISPATEKAIAVSDIHSTDQPLLMCSPNPAQRAMTIRTAVQAPAEAQYDIYTMSGELVRSMSTPASTDHTLLWDLRNNAQQRVAGGVYVLRMKIGGTVTAATIHVLP
ncbi:MAG: hypothetical protein ACK45R_08895 [Candidatus Kapaibacterium sp.]